MSLQVRPLLAGGFAASALAHGALFAAMTWHAAVPRAAVRPAAPARMALVWLSAAAATPAAATPKAMPRAEVPAKKTVARAAPAAAPAASAPEPISGAVFGLPSIGFGGGGGARWLRHRGDEPAAPPPQAIAQAMHEAERAQSTLALQQQRSVETSDIDSP